MRKIRDSEDRLQEMERVTRKKEFEKQKETWRRAI